MGPIMNPKGLKHMFKQQHQTRGGDVPPSQKEGKSQKQPEWRRLLKSEPATSQRCVEVWETACCIIANEDEEENETDAGIGFEEDLKWNLEILYGTDVHRRGIGINDAVASLSSLWPHRRKLVTLPVRFRSGDEVLISDLIPSSSNAAPKVVQKTLWHQFEKQSGRIETTGAIVALASNMCTATAEDMHLECGSEDVISKVFEAILLPDGNTRTMSEAEFSRCFDVVWRRKANADHILTCIHRAKEGPVNWQAEEKAREEAFESLLHAAEDAKKNEAATKLQARHRGNKARQEVDRLKAELEEEKQNKEDKENGAATKIQSSFRGRRGRAAVEALKEQKEKEEQEEREKKERERGREEAEAATKLQASVRGRRARQEVEEMRKERAREEEEEERKRKEEEEQEERERARAREEKEQREREEEEERRRREEEEQEKERERERQQEEKENKKQKQLEEAAARRRRELEEEERAANLREEARRKEREEIEQAMKAIKKGEADEDEDTPARGSSQRATSGRNRRAELTKKKAEALSTAAANHEARTAAATAAVGAATSSKLVSGATLADELPGPLSRADSLDSLDLADNSGFAKGYTQASPLVYPPSPGDISFADLRRARNLPTTPESYNYGVPASSRQEKIQSPYDYGAAASSRRDKSPSNWLSDSFSGGLEARRQSDLGLLKLLEGPYPQSRARQVNPDGSLRTYDVADPPTSIGASRVMNLDVRRSPSAPRGRSMWEQAEVVADAASRPSGLGPDAYRRVLRVEDQPQFHWLADEMQAAPLPPNVRVLDPRSTSLAGRKVRGSPTSMPPPMVWETSSGEGNQKPEFSCDHPYQDAFEQAVALATLLETSESPAVLLDTAEEVWTEDLGTKIASWRQAPTGDYVHIETGERRVSDPRPNLWRELQLGCRLVALLRARAGLQPMPKA